MIKKKRGNYTQSDVDSDRLASGPVRGVARPSPLLGHSMGTLRLYKLPREVQKLIGGLGASFPQEFYSLPGRF